MSQTPIEANVVLTADNSQYDSQMQGSAAQTDQLGHSIDSLGGKIDRLAKSAGKKFITFGAGDVAGITAATLAYGAFEKQMSTLQAQAVALNRSVVDQKKSMTDYTNTVNNLRGTFGLTTREAADLTLQLNKISDSTTTVDKLANTFVRLSAVTGESSTGLMNSMVQFQKVMGAPQRETDKLSNQLTVLQAQSNASAQSILDFGSQIAPVARQVGMSATDVMGFSNAFIKAGQDGYRAATVFNRMMSDISVATQTGSPDLAKYSNLVGMTVNQFKELGGTDKFLRVIESINRQGPAAITQLNQMGYDGMSTVRTITALAQSGGLQKELDAARNATPGTLSDASNAAMGGLFDNMAKLRSELTMTAESFGKNFAGPMTAFIKVMDAGAAAVHAFMDSGLGKLAAVVAGIAAGFSGLAGAILMSGKALLAFSALNATVRNSFTAGFRDTAKDMFPAQRAAALAQGGIKAGVTEGYTPLGVRGAEMAAANPNWVANMMYRGGVAFGLRAPGGLYGGPGGGPGPISRGLNAAAYYGMTGTGWLARSMLGYQFAPGTVKVPGLEDTGGLTNPALRPTLFSSPTLRGSFSWLPKVGQGIREGAANFYSTVYGDGSQIPKTQVLPTAQPPLNWSNGLASPGSNGLLTSAKSLASQFKSVEGASRTFGAGLQNLARDLTKTGMMVGAAGVGAGKTMGSWLMGGVSSLMGNPLTMAMLGIGVYSALKNNTSYQKQDMSGAIDPYAQAGGMTPVTSTAATSSNAPPPAPSSVGSALTVSAQDTAYARTSTYNPTSSMFTQSKYTPQQAQDALGTQWQYISQNPQAIQSLKLDLINAYGTQGATTILNNLQNGTAQNINFGNMVKPAFEVNRQWFGLKGEDQSKIGAPINSAFGVINDRARMAGMYGGSAAQFNVLGSSTNDLIAGLYSGYQSSDLTKNENTGDALMQGNINIWGDITGGKSFGTGLTSGSMGPLGSMNESKLSPARMKALADALGQNGLGTSFTQSDMKTAMDAMVKAKTATDATKAFWTTYFTSTDVSAADKANVLTDRGIKLATAQKMTANQSVAAMMQFGLSFTPASTNFNDPNSLGSRISRLGGVGQFWQDADNQYAVTRTGDANVQMQGAQDLIAKMRAKGMSDQAIYRALGNVKSQAQTSTASEYQYADMAQQFIGRDLGFSQADMSRTQLFGSQTSQFQAAMAINPGDENQQQNQQQAIQTYFDQVQQQKQYFTGLLYQQREYNVSRSRAEEDYNLQRTYEQHDYSLMVSRSWQDFNLQRSYEEQDFNLQRQRAEEQYAIQRNRAETQFSISQKRAVSDFNLQRLRQEQDYQHQVLIMQEQAAQQMYNIYQRTPVQRTSDANWTLYNATEQLQAMKEQEAQLSALRKKGMSDQAIQQLGLTDPKNQQQLARFYDDVLKDPSLVKKFNESVQKRIAAAGKLVTDSSSMDWQEFQRQYELSRTRAQQDFQKSMNRAQADFKRQMDYMAQDFKIQMAQANQDFKTTEERQAQQHQIMLDRAATDYQTTMDRQAAEYAKTMQRSAEDLNRSAQTIDGSFADILTQATNKLSGHAQKQALAVIQQFKDLKNSVGPEAVSLMQALAAIFGVKFDPPAVAKDWSQRGTPNSGGGRSMPTLAEGGVLPGWSPGHDNHIFYSPTGGMLALSGGEAVMRPEWTRAMGEKEIARQNEMAKRGLLPKQAFSGGGVYRPTAIGSAHSLQVEGGFNATDISPLPIGSPVHAIEAGRVTTSTDLRGFEPRLAALGIPQNGYRSYGKYIVLDHGAFSSIYAHLSQRFASLNQQVSGGMTIGLSGDTGWATGPHLHFGVAPGSPFGFMGASTNYAGAGSAGPALSGSGGAGGVGGPAMTLGGVKRKLMQNFYKNIEHNVSKLSQIQPFAPGDMSGIINKMYGKAIESYYSKHKDMLTAPGGVSGVNPSAPANVTGNVAIGKAMAASIGWTGPEWDALYRLWTNESGWRTTIKNPSSPAYGIPQADPGSKMASAGADWATNPRTQIKWGLNYIKSQYTDPINALTFWNRTDPRPYPGHWYGEGGIFNGPQSIGVGERGPEMVLPLNDKGANFIQNILQRSQVGSESKMTNTYHRVTPMAHNLYNTYNIDRSTTFSGAIQVTASDPNQFIAQMQAKQRAAALTRPVLGGSR